MSEQMLPEPPPPKFELLKPPGASLFQKLAEITSEIGQIEARGFHSFYRTSYVEESDLVEAVRTKLAARNVFMAPSIFGVDGRPGKTAKGKDTYITTVLIAFTFCDGDTGETHRCEWAGQGEDIGSDGVSKAVTSALRYFLLKGFLVSASEAKEPTAPQAAPRADGQNGLSDEQYQGILAAFKQAGSYEPGLHDLLDTQDVPRSIEGNDLSLSQRVRLLGALDAIEVQKGLMEAVPA